MELDRKMTFSRGIAAVICSDRSEKKGSARLLVPHQCIPSSDFCTRGPLLSVARKIRGENLSMADMRIKCAYHL